MILDEVLQEENRSFDMDDMVDIFTEGFLYALEMQEAGYKAGSTEELSEKLAEAASIAISEISDDLANHASDVARKKAESQRKIDKINGYITLKKRGKNNKTAFDYEKQAKSIDNRIANKAYKKHNNF